MAGGTLVVSRYVKNHLHYKKRLETLGFSDVTVTALDKDGLKFLIRDLRPSLLMMGARFYHCCTPFMMGELHKAFPKIKMAALCIGEYPPDIAMYFILNGISSYVCSAEGTEQFYFGLGEIAKGRGYVSPEVAKHIEMRRVRPDAAGKITERHKQIVRLICCGFRDIDIAATLECAKSTIENHKTEIFTSLNVTSSFELIRAALTLEIVKLEDLYFYPRGLMVNPRPGKRK